ncbi:MAG TPA: hypothetical protein VNM91_03260 [Dehalococcoidia bacterium]|nr:hypothetical protein [Dehalococcoidia bacterium]
MPSIVAYTGVPMGTYQSTAGAPSYAAWTRQFQPAALAAAASAPG